MLVRLKDILNIVQGDFVCLLDGERANIVETEYDGYAVTAMTARNGVIEIALAPWTPPRASADADWYRERAQQSGTDPGFF